MASNTDDFDLDRICDQELLDSLTILVKPIFAREVNYNYYSFTDTQKQEYLNFHKESLDSIYHKVGVAYRSPLQQLLFRIIHIFSKDINSLKDPNNHLYHSHY
jgi:hypothetical protein